MSISLQTYNEHQQATSCTSTPKPTLYFLLPYPNPADLEFTSPLTGNHSKSCKSLNCTRHSITCRNMRQPWKVVEKHFENFKVHQWRGYTNLKVASASMCLQKELMIVSSSENRGPSLSPPADSKHCSIKVLLSVMRYRQKALEPGNTQDVLHRLSTTNP